ncbi:MAG TPA: serine--tRNA ligase [Chthoniobacteraceae bacterium]|nr:serine--tRNA ligase [Chthoniobacteraceae bacterium]
MLDIRLIRENPELIKTRLATRGGDAHLQIDAILEIDTERRKLETHLQHLQAERNRISKEIGAKKKAGEDTGEIEAKVRGFGEEMTDLNKQAAAADERQRNLLLNVPNLPHEGAPVGGDASANPVVRTWGEKPAIANPLDHIKLGEKLGLFDLERAAKLSGSGFVCFTGIGARLQRALINFCLDLHSREHGYTEVSPPFVVRADSLIGTGQLPKFRDQLYKVEGEDLFLIPTAEVPVTNLHREEILAAGDLPKKFVAYTPCFRSEAGAAGIGTRGIIRVHQFDKVELVKITTPENSFTELDSLTADAEKVLQLLGLHYRVIELCTGDIGFGSTKTYDIEVWAPGQNAYLEVSSCSNFGDFQARRMNLKYKDAEGKNKFCHTLNGSGTAMPRLYVALLETYQQPDGSVKVPAPLQAQLGTDILK